MNTESKVRELIGLNPDMKRDQAERIVKGLQQNNESLQAENAALKAELERVRDALRKLAINSHEYAKWCGVCQADWPPDGNEPAHNLRDGKPCPAAKPTEG